MFLGSVGLDFGMIAGSKALGGGTCTVEVPHVTAGDRVIARGLGNPESETGGIKPAGCEHEELKSWGSWIYASPSALGGNQA